MKRRLFLGTSAGTAALLSNFAGCTKGKNQNLNKNLSVLHDDGTLGGHTLEEIRTQFRYDIYNDFIPFHDKYVIDHQYGGFMTDTGWNGPNLSTNKNGLIEGRGIWTYSFLYNNLDKNFKHLEAARKSVEFLLKHKPDTNHYWPISYSRDGKVIGGQGGSFPNDVYIAYGLSEYAKAVGDDTFWNLAKENLVKHLKAFDRPTQTRTQGLWFLTLCVSTQMLMYRYDLFVENAAKRAVDAIMNYHYNPEYDLHGEIIKHDLSRPDDDNAQKVNFGHCFQAIWMVLHEALRNKDRELFELAAKRLKRHVEVSWDDVYQGLYSSCNHINNNEWALSKTAWVQGEALTGLFCVVEHTGAQWAKDWIGKLYTYMIEKFPLKKYRLPLWLGSGDRKVVFVKGEKANHSDIFHHPRHIMLNLLSVERMIKRKGKLSGIFA